MSSICKGGAASAAPPTMDTLTLAVLTAHAFEVMLDRWCGLGMWEYSTALGPGDGAGDITTDVDTEYRLVRSEGRASFVFTFPVSVAIDGADSLLLREEWARL